MNNVDAVVIASGPNGLVAAATLADAGWDVAVSGGAADARRAVRSAELVPGFTSDLFSVFHPLSTVSPALRGLDLESHGLRWSHAPRALGQARSAAGEDAPVIHPDPADTAADLERRQPGDGAAWSARRGRGRALPLGDAVTGIDVRSGRAVGVRTASGVRYTARRAVIADVSAPALYGSLLPDHAVPACVRADLEHFEWGTPVLKVNYALSQKIPWRSPSLSGAGTVYLGADDRGSPRSAEGTESAWAYTHLPRDITDDASADLLAARVDEVLEAHAPGFSERVVGRVVQRPSDLEAADANLVGGAVNGGTAQFHQQLVFRPGPGTSRSETAPRSARTDRAGGCGGARRAP
ncbi:phytoene desaturase family protein [Rhodococcus jostii]|uniref:phytoene desaturase family protein n=1 Tax=Rhodococcus jostii TaxID=132919 RepID=UPI00364A8916